MLHRHCMIERCQRNTGIMCIKSINAWRKKKTKKREHQGFVVTGGIMGCQNDNFRCRHWRQNLHVHWGETWCANVHVRASKMEDGKCGAQTRCHFSHFNTDFRLQTDVQESSYLAWINAISNLTESVLYWCWAAREIWRKMRERTCIDALTYIASKQRMRERTIRCANERFLVPTNEYWLLASLFRNL